MARDDRKAISSIARDSGERWDASVGLYYHAFDLGGAQAASDSPLLPFADFGAWESATSLLTFPQAPIILGQDESAGSDAVAPSSAAAAVATLPSAPAETGIEPTLQTNDTLSATQTAVLVPGATTDLDGDNVIDPGDTVLFTVTITNNSINPGALDALGVQFTELLTGLTPTGTINISPVAFGDSYTAVGNTLLEVGNATGQTGPQSSVAGSVLTNDVEFLGDTFTISSFQASSAFGGTVTMITTGVDAGSFTYVSAAGFEGTDTFTYTIRDGGLDNIEGNADDLVSTATVTIQVGGAAGQAWYVDSSFAGTSTGTSTNPYKTLAEVSGGAGGDGVGDHIYVNTGSGNYDGGITLLNNQTLVGEGSLFAIGATNIAAAGADPTIVNTGATNGGHGVVLASGNILTGFTVGNTGGYDIANTTDRDGRRADHLQCRSDRLGRPVPGGQRRRRAQRHLR